MKLHGYWRSTATWRVRIALNLKGVAYEQVPHHLRLGEQRDPAYLALNPQGFVPALELDDGTVLTQSLAIISWLEDRYPLPALKPADATARARVRAVAQVIACDVHPVQNLKVLKKLKALGHDQATIDRWAAEVIEEGLDAVEALCAGNQGPFLFDGYPTLADILLVPQLGNARRFGARLDQPTLLRAEAACAELDAFRRAVPEVQPDAETP